MANQDDYKSVIAESTPIVGRERELRQLSQILHKTRMRNCILVGEPGVGKTALVREMARRHADTHVFVEISMGSLEAGTDYRGDFSKKLIDGITREIAKSLIDQKNRQRVLFIDEIHTIVTTGSMDGRDTSLSAANILKPYLSSGEITVWGATTPGEYFRTIARDGALSRRMPPVFIEPMSGDAVRQVISKFCGGRLADEQISAIMKVCENGIPEAAEPDVGIEMADRLMAALAIDPDADWREELQMIGSDMQRQYDYFSKAKKEIAI